MNVYLINVGMPSISLLYWNGLSVVVKICSSEISPSVTFILFTLFSMEIDFVFIIGVKLSQNKELAENAKRASRRQNFHFSPYLDHNTQAQVYYFNFCQKKNEIENRNQEINRLLLISYQYEDDNIRSVLSIVHNYYFLIL